MKRVIGAALAACALLWAGAANATVVFFEEGVATRHIGSSFKPTSPGRYRLTITTDRAASLYISTYFEEHWDIFFAPAPRPHSEFIMGHSDPVQGGAGIFGTALTFDFLLPEPTIEYFLSGGAGQYGVPVGTELYKTVEYVRPDLIFSVESRGNLTPFNYTMTATAIPEPSTWIIMIIGFSLAGAGLRRARPQVHLPA